MKNTTTDENFEKEIARTYKFVLVDFIATWCEPCSILAPILEKISDEFKEKIILVKVDVKEAPLTAQKFRVEKIPTMVLFKDGKPISGFTGMVPEQSIKNWMENIFEKHGKN